MKRGRTAALVLAGLPVPFEGPWVPLHGRCWQVVPIPQLVGVSEIQVVHRGQRRMVPLDGLSDVIFEADRGRFVLRQRVEGLPRLSIILREVCT